MRISRASDRGREGRSEESRAEQSSAKSGAHAKRKKKEAKDSVDQRGGFYRVPVAKSEE
jgi:hypothetical protein